MTRYSQNQLHAQKVIQNHKAWLKRFSTELNRGKLLNFFSFFCKLYMHTCVCKTTTVSMHDTNKPYHHQRRTYVSKNSQFESPIKHRSPEKPRSPSKQHRHSSNPGEVVIRVKVEK